MSIIGPSNDSHANNLNMNNKRIINVSNPSNNQDAVTKHYCDINVLTSESNCLLINGTNPMEANLNMNSKKIINVLNPTNNHDVATKDYIDTKYNGHNVFIGNSSGGSNTTGNGNYALGYRSMVANTIGCDNVAIGSFTLTTNTSGNSNISIGKNTLTSNTNGGNNIAICSNALDTNATGNNNFAAGFNALTASTIANNNICIGTNSLLKNEAGSNNIAFGTSSLTNLTTGNNNVAIGYTIGGGGSGRNYSSSESNNICIAASGSVGDNNTITIGNTNHAKCYIRGIHNITTGSGGIPVFISPSHQLGTVTSSRRFKENIATAQNYDISKLRVVKFNYINDETKTQHIGLIAEEVEKIYPELIAYDDNNVPYTVKYTDLIPILLQKVQQLENRL